jgi:hypothetical protein
LWEYLTKINFFKSLTGLSILTRKLHLSDDQSRHICIKTFTKQNLDIHGYQFVINKNMSLTGYQMSYKGAAGKAFSAHMPTSN